MSISPFGDNKLTDLMVYGEALSNHNSFYLIVFSSSMSWTERHQTLQNTLNLRNNPIGITFSNEVPEGVSKFEADYPDATEDGRTGAVSAGCEFWIHSTDQTFYTEEADHGNCSVGSVTHGFKQWEDVFNNSDVATVLECEWVTQEQVDEITTLEDDYKHVTYGPLKESPVDPDVVLIRINAEQMMRLKDAFPDIRVEGKPQCHIVPMAKDQQIPVISSGCALSRKRTGMSNNEMTATIPADIFDEVMDQLQEVCQIDDMVGEYAKEDKQRFIS